MEKVKNYEPEILAPAGELKSVIGAINAGADAVYLGAPSFSARAFAKNLTVEEIVEAVQYAHLFGKKIYLALNTLLKEAELKEALAMIKPLYEAGLDAIIVQDLGLLSLLHKYYPELAIHASTQMAILSSAGVDFLKKHGVTRVVPGRELTLAEIRRLREVGLELECFIHGAMCYSYSGKCLLSSLAGGRSGNRGRCAGPCRKEYCLENGEKGYFLSMKDMCSIDCIGALIDAGVDSFKIEGRMKSPEYSAGVTAIYRKYVDKYLSEGKCEVSEEDRNLLRSIYIRSKIQEGYLNKYNGRDMISVKSPSYQSMPDELQEKIREQYISFKLKKEVEIDITVYVGAPITLVARCDGKEVTIEGGIPEQATKKAMTASEIEKQMKKTGNTPFSVTATVYTDEASFVTISALNELRRNALDAILKELVPGRKALEMNIPVKKEKNSDFALTHTPSIRIGIKNNAQYKAVWESMDESVEGIIVPLTEIDKLDFSATIEKGRNLYLRLPEVVREIRKEKIYMYLEKAKKLDIFREIYCPSLDALEMAGSFWEKEQLILDAGLYVFNEAAEEFVLQHAKRYTTSYELNERELQSSRYKWQREMVIYGYIPVMYSANCVEKTCNTCNKRSDKRIIIDEKHREFTIHMEHELCINTMYNCVPLSILSEIEKGMKLASVYRMEFTIEDYDTTKAFLQKYKNRDTRASFPEEKGENQFTRGHFRRRVE